MSTKFPQESDGDKSL